MELMAVDNFCCGHFQDSCHTSGSKRKVDGNTKQNNRQSVPVKEQLTHR